MKKSVYKKRLRNLQIELVKLQRHLITDEKKVLVILEGRDAAGKDGTIKRLIEHMSPRETRVMALGKPTDFESRSWYFQRYVPYLPVPMEFVVFNRSWYNRAGVEKVMGFCSSAQHQEFMETVVSFERMVARSGVTIFKYYLDISREAQALRLDERERDPLSQWKISPIDKTALDHFDAYTEARNEMLLGTTHPDARWVVIRTDNKRTGRIALISDLLERMDYKDKSEAAIAPDRKVAFRFSPAILKKGRLAG